MIKLLTSLAGNDEETGRSYSFSPGEKVSLGSAFEKRLVDSGQAEKLKAAPKKKTTTDK
tara:strand:- start:1203 stop:1379 length:177 start_codon:yes stop_codon:yes gene_type:complete